LIDKWSTEELIQEVFLSGAEPSEIINWLKSNVGDIHEITDFTSDSFWNLREKYEIEWARSEDQKLNLAVCLYGKNDEALRELFFGENPTFIKEAVLKNHWFCNYVGLDKIVQLSKSGLKPNEVMGLYTDFLEDKKNRLFFRIFWNISLDEDFLLKVFSGDEPFDVIKHEHLLDIFGILTHQRQENYFNKKRNNGYTQERFESLVNKLTHFISNQDLHGIDENGKKWCRVRETWSLRTMLEDTAELETKGGVHDENILSVTDENILSKFSVSQFPEEELDDYIRDNLWFIQRELARRCFSGYLYDSVIEKLEKFALSESVEMRMIFYSYAPLSSLYGSNQHVFEYGSNPDVFDSVFFSLRNYEFFEGENTDVHFDSREQEAVISSFKAHLEKDEFKFAAALALNRNHYQSKNAREFLRRLCSFSDSKFDRFLVWPWGWRTAGMIFESKCEELREKEVDFFKDEASEDVVLDEVKSLKDEFVKQTADLRQDFKKQQWEIDELNRKLDSVLALVVNTSSNVEEEMLRSDEMKEELKERLGEPTDLLSKIVFRIPILGRWLKYLLR